MKRLYLFSGLAIFVISAFIFIENLKVNEVHKNGNVIKARIVDKSRSCQGTKNKYIKVFYLEKLYSIRVKKYYCERHQIGDVVDLKHLDGYARLVLPEENGNDDLLFGAVLIAIGIVLMILGIVKKQ